MQDCKTQLQYRLTIIILDNQGHHDHDDHDDHVDPDDPDDHTGWRLISIIVDDHDDTLQVSAPPSFIQSLIHDHNDDI